MLDWQIRTAGEAGCAGVVVFSWTDEWFRSGREILDWRFGLTDRDRHAKPALATTTAAFRDFPLAEGEPRVRWSRSWCAATTARARCARR